MTSSNQKSAETNFREAFERLKAEVPKVLPMGTPVSQNNVAREAGCDPSALRKSRFPDLVTEIQNFLGSHTSERPISERQRLLKQRQQSRNARETIADLKAQRDALASLLVEANAKIYAFARRIQDLEVRLESLQGSATVLPLPTKSRKGPFLP